MRYSVIGLMSGTSLDGIDIAFCEFRLNKDKWTFEIHQAETIPYTRSWKDRLSAADTIPALELIMLDRDFGHFTGKLVRSFIDKHSIHPDFIASHGHTVFHQPGNGLTLQIGHGPAIRAETGIPVVCDFRSLDVALGGQGAPLVPIGDRLLFSDYDFCLNIGGFANISFEAGDKRIAYDTGPANIVLNQLASRAGYSYDRDGFLARQGKIDHHLLENLNACNYYNLPPPKSLGKEWVSENINPILSDITLPVGDLIATFCEHIAIQIGEAIRKAKVPETKQFRSSIIRSPKNKPGSSGRTDRGDWTESSEIGNLEERCRKRILVTGGGALNLFLVERIAHYADADLVIPDRLTVEFKEALIFAFLGVLRWRNEPNCLKSVTGAMYDASGGGIF